MLVFVEEGKPEFSEKNPWSKEPTANSTHSGRRRVLLPPHHPGSCSPCMCAKGKSNFEEGSGLLLKLNYHILFFLIGGEGCKSPSILPLHLSVNELF